MQTLANSLVGKRWEDVSRVPAGDSTYLTALMRLEHVIQLSLRFEAEVLLKSADVRRSADFRVRTYLAYAASEAFRRAEQLGPGTREGAGGAGEDPLRGPRRPPRTK